MIETETQIHTPSAPDLDTQTYEACEQCSSPMDEAQRYCVVCGAHRHTASDPVARYLASARRPRAGAVASVAAPPSRSDHRWTVLALVLLPIAAAGGVLVGRGGNHSDAAILAALRAQKPPVVQVGGAGAGNASTSAGGGTSSAASAISSDFTLSKGFVVRLRTLPASSDSAAVSRAKQQATAKGASAVGVINPADFALKPGTGGAFLIYSGQFKTHAQAAKALSKLKGKFPGAAVVAVSPSSSSSSSASASSAGGGAGGSSASAARQAAADTAPPTAAQKAQGEKIVQQIQAKKGKSYVQQQQNLPDTIVVP